MVTEIDYFDGDSYEPFCPINHPAGRKTRRRILAKLRRKLGHWGKRWRLVDARLYQMDKVKNDPIDPPEKPMIYDWNLVGPALMKIPLAELRNFAWEVVHADAQIGFDNETQTVGVTHGKLRPGSLMRHGKEGWPVCNGREISHDQNLVGVMIVRSPLIRVVNRWSTPSENPFYRIDRACGKVC